MNVLTPEFDPRVRIEAWDRHRHQVQLGPTAQLVCASTIQPEPISWLWSGYLARGKLQLLAGQPGMGKTSVAMKIAATVSSGIRWPDGSHAPQGKVVIWSGEDDPADTLVPRLDASGADLRFVHFVSTVVEDGQRRPFDPAKDVGALEAGIKAAGGASLIIVDPIVSAASGDSHKNSETRRGLQPLVDMAARIDAALLGITHFTKGSEGRSPVDRVTGSVAFGALPRVVFVAAKQQEVEDEKPLRVFMRAKSNIGPDDGGFAYELQLTPMLEHPDIIASTVVWGDAVSGSAQDVLAIAEANDDGEATGRFREAKDWLLDFIMAGPKSAKECKAAARDAGHSWRTIERAKADLKIKSMKTDDGWVWGLPQDQDRQFDGGNSATSPYPGGVDGLGGVQQNQQLTSGQDRQSHQERQERQGRHGFGGGDVEHGGRQ